MRALWARLSLRVQAAIAVILPCLAVALFSSVYFPARMNGQARESIEAQARSVGRLAASQSAALLRETRESGRTLSELDVMLDAIKHLDNVQQFGILELTTEQAAAGPERFIVLGEGGARALGGNLAPARYRLPPPGQCITETGGALTVTCSGSSKEISVAVIIRYSVDTFEQQRQTNEFLGLGVLVAGLGLSLLLAFYLSGAIAGPLSVVSRVAREVANGDVSVPRLEVSGANEVQSMAFSVNEMLVSIRTLVSEMVALTSRLTEAAKGLTAASSDQEHVTTQQSAHAQEIAATFEELSRTAEMITRSTEIVEQAAARTNNGVDEARALVGEMVQGISDIRKEAKEVAEAITQLNVELQQVSRIALVIKQVADRSDLLALNASLEGTKAGEVGRGFSVVAAEMRKLAESVAQSARDIGTIVESVKQSGDTAVSRAKQGVEASDRGMQVAERASTAFQQILELSRGTKEAAQQIAVATRQQRYSSEQAVVGARSVAQLLQQGVDATGRTTKIAQDLQASVNALNGVTGRFKVSEKN
jgi:methyl-accepting chemotaxis protein